MIKKSKYYRVGSGGIRALLGGDKQRAIDFEQDKYIEVSEEEYNKIAKLPKQAIDESGEFLEVKDGTE